MKTTTLFALLSGAFALVSTSHAQTVANGTFDDPSYGGGQNGHAGDPVYFSTVYTWTPPIANANTAAGQYTVATVARPWNPFGTNVYGDHTTGFGKYLIVNGDTTTNKLVWQQTISGFNIGSQYSFRGWISNWSGGPAGVVNFFANAAQQGASISSTTTANTWFLFDRPFTATATSMTLGLVSTSVASGGNDFAFDDLSVVPVPEPATWLVLGSMAALFKRARRRAQPLNPKCLQTPSGGYDSLRKSSIGFPSTRILTLRTVGN